jgi:hypothetical protein
MVWEWFLAILCLRALGCHLGMLRDVVISIHHRCEGGFVQSDAGQPRRSPLSLRRAPFFEISSSALVPALSSTARMASVTTMTW